MAVKPNVKNVWELKIECQIWMIPDSLVFLWSSHKINIFTSIILLYYFCFDMHFFLSVFVHISRNEIYSPFPHIKFFYMHKSSMLMFKKNGWLSLMVYYENQRVMIFGKWYRSAP